MPTDDTAGRVADNDDDAGPPVKDSGNPAPVTHENADILNADIQNADIPNVNAPATHTAAGFNSTLGKLALVGAVLIFSSNGAVYKRMYTHDSKLFSVCNVLCGANLFGLVTLVPLFWRQLTLANA